MAGNPVNRYTDVDRHLDIEAAATWLDNTAEWPFFLELKAVCRKLLNATPGAIVVDVGCGTGADHRKLAHSLQTGGLLVGFDRSEKLLRHALRCSRSTNFDAKYIKGDLLKLPFRAETVDGVRADRVLQYINHPDTAVKEMRRILKPGKRLVISDPDQESLMINHPNQILFQKIKRIRRDIMRQNGAGAHKLSRVIQRCGFSSLEVDARVLLLRKLDIAFDAVTWGDRAFKFGQISLTDRDEWVAGLRALDAEGNFVFAITYFTVAGTK